jgi:hypothetical protein
MDHITAKRFADDWYSARNAHDLGRILSLYADDVEVSSPLVSILAEKPDGEIVGTEALRAYFAAGLEKYPAHQFEPVTLFVGVNSLVLHYLGASGRPAAEFVVLNDQGQIAGYRAHYAGDAR